MTDTTNPATENPLDENRIPARYEVELTDEETQLHITPETVVAFSDEQQRRGHKEYRCTLTQRKFTAPIGGTVYVLHMAHDKYLLDPPYLHPKTVARGVGFVRQKLREKIAAMRSNLRFELEKVAMLERGAGQEIVYNLPDT